MTRVAFWSVLAVCGLCAVVVAQEKSDKPAGQAARAQEKATQEKTVTAKPWFDLEHCAMCKHLGAQEGLMDAMKWEVHKIDNGMMMVAHVPKNMMEKMKKAEEAMQAAVKELASGKNLEMCGFCECYGNLAKAGMQVQEFKGETGSISLMTSDKPEVVKQIHEMADRTIKEQKMLAQTKQTSTKSK